MNKYLVILGVWLLVAWGCDPCADCGEPLVYDPTVKMVFINQDSINQLSDSVNINKDSLSALSSLRTAANDTISNLTDTISALQDLIDDGNQEYSDELAYFTQISDSIEDVRTLLSNKTKVLDSLNKLLNAVVTTMNSGNVQLKNVVLQNNGTELFFEDSMNRFSLPLLLGTVGEYMETTYDMTIGDESYSISIGYETFETIDDARIARVRARNTDIVFSSFDSLKVNCPTDCISDETTVTLYF